MSHRAGAASPDDVRALVSIVVRSMGRTSLAPALTSIAHQSYSPIEIVLVSACGPVHPPLPELGTMKPRVILPTERLKRSAAANAGLAAARGEWITFLDDDDILHPDHLAGLVNARSSPAPGVLHCLAHSVFADGSPERIVGQPHALVELFDRNYIHLSAALLSREAAAGCRFDESLDILEDWDFFLQIAQRARFQFVPQATFVWHADAGNSGAGGGRNFNADLFSSVRARIHAKWRPARQVMATAVGDLLEKAQTAFDQRDLASAESACREALLVSQNHPVALNMLAIVEQARGDQQSALATLELAHAVRPHDVRLLHNLALLCAASGKRARAEECVRRALSIDATFGPVLRLEALLRTGDRAGNAV